MRRLRVVGLAVWAAVAVGLLSFGGASAAPLSANRAAAVAPAAAATGTLVATSPMTMVGFDAAVASHNGYGAAIPENTVGGNCGTSSIYLSGLPGAYLMTTGFTLTTVSGAYDYSWNAAVTGPANYFKNWGYGGLLLDRHQWSASANASVRAGSYTASVNSVSSFVILANGLVCHSGGPFAHASVG